MAKVRELLDQRASQSVISRNQEVAHLLDTFSQKAPLVVHLHGIAGIGKSTLLEVFAARARQRKIPVIRLDCRLIEPTERGFLHQLSAALGRKALTLGKASA
jgi:predicted alpha/beta-fold hydrolase